MDLKVLLAQARSIRERSKKTDELLKQLFAHVNPSQYPPFMEHDEFTGFIEGVRSVNRSLGDDLAWYFWEIKINGKERWNLRTDRKEYKIKDDADFLEYLQDTYGLRIM